MATGVFRLTLKATPPAITISAPTFMVKSSYVPVRIQSDCTLLPESIEFKIIDRLGATYHPEYTLTGNVILTTLNPALYASGPATMYITAKDDVWNQTTKTFSFYIINASQTTISLPYDVQVNGRYFESVPTAGNLLYDSWAAFDHNPAKPAIWSKTTSALTCTSSTHALSGMVNTSSTLGADYRFGARIAVPIQYQAKNIFGLVFRFTDSENFYFFGWDSDGYHWSPTRRRLYKMSQGVLTALWTMEHDGWVAGLEYRLDVEIKGNIIKIIENNKVILTYTDNNEPLMTGTYGVITGSQPIEVRNVYAGTVKDFLLSDTFSTQLDINNYDVEHAKIVNDSNVGMLMSAKLAEFISQNKLNANDIMVSQYQVSSQDGQTRLFFNQDNPKSFTYNGEDLIYGYWPFATTTPNQPTNFKVTYAGSTLIWTWDDNAFNEDGYNLLNEYGGIIATLPAGTTEYREPAYDGTFMRRLIAYNFNGESLPSDPVTITIPIPTFEQPPEEKMPYNLFAPYEVENLAIVKKGLDDYLLKWQASTVVQDTLADKWTPEGFKVYVNDEPAHVVDKVFYQLTLVPGTYEIKVTAFNAAGESAPTTLTVEIKDDPVPETPIFPSAPTNFKVNLGGALIAGLNWDFPPTEDIDGFIVYDSNNTIVDITAPDVTSTILQLAYNMTYEYYVVAFNQYGEGFRSDPASVTTGPEPVYKPDLPLVIDEFPAEIEPFDKEDGTIPAFQSGIGSDLDLTVKTNANDEVSEIFSYTLQFVGYTPKADGSPGAPWLGAKTYGKSTLVKQGDVVVLTDKVISPQGPGSSYNDRTWTPGVTGYKVVLTSDNPNVELEVLKQPDDFAPLSNYVYVSFTARIINPAQSSWRPFVHNGYYYLNQAEYFLYAKDEVQGKLIDSSQVQEWTFSFAIDVLCRRGESGAETYSIPFTATIPCDQGWHEVTGNLNDEANSYLVANGIDTTDLTIEEFGEPYTGQPGISFSTTTIVKARTNDLSVTNVLDQSKIVVSGNRALVTPIPQQGCPVIVVDSVGEMVHVNFTDEQGNPTLDAQETVVYAGNKVIPLAYRDIDPDSLSVKVAGEEINAMVNDSTLYLSREYDLGTEFNVSYRLARSFYVDYNYDLVNDMAQIMFHGIEASDGEVKVYYETNKDSAYQRIDEINLNPLSNPLNAGFIYLTDKTYPTARLEMSMNPDTINANGYDKVTVRVVAKDKYGNPVIGETINLKLTQGNVVKGNLVILNNVTDQYGTVIGVVTADKAAGTRTVTATASNGVTISNTLIQRVEAALPKIALTIGTIGSSKKLEIFGYNMGNSLQMRITPLSGTAISTPDPSLTFTTTTTYTLLYTGSESHDTMIVSSYTPGKLYIICVEVINYNLKQYIPIKF